jgi:3-deoxy-D-manno-octulosonic-acid transferase
MSRARLYRFATTLARPVAELILQRRIRAGKEDPDRINERRGIASFARPEGPLIWMHGASVGETSMLLPVIKRLLAEDHSLHILVTSGTMTSAQMLNDRLPEGAFHQMMPLDVPAYVQGFLDHWQPDLAVWAESEIWPNLVLQTHATGTPMALINARMSQKSVDGWRARRGFARQVFGAFDAILPADTLTHNALRFLGGNVVSDIGNLKAAAPALDVDKAELDRLRLAIGDRPIWLAASTHPPEEAQVLAAHQAVREKQAEALLIWVPRHPERGVEIAALSEDMPLAHRSQHQTPDAATSIYLMDTLGEMGLALGLSDVAFVGGSLDATLTGHNPLEPARAGVPILTGPHVASFTEVYDRFFKAKAAMRVKPKTLAKSVSALLGDGAAAGQMAARARAVAEESDGVLELTVTTLQDLMS